MVKVAHCRIWSYRRALVAVVADAFAQEIRMRYKHGCDDSIMYYAGVGF